MQAANVPPQYRHVLGISHLLTLVNGVRGTRRFPPKKMISVLELLVDELLDLWVTGVEVELDGRPMRVRVMLLKVLGDYRGLAAVVGTAMKQSPAAHACFVTWLDGIKGPLPKMVYQYHTR